MKQKSLHIKQQQQKSPRIALKKKKTKNNAKKIQDKQKRRLSQAKKSRCDNTTKSSRKIK